MTSTSSSRTSTAEYSPLQRARADASSILASFVTPPGSRRLSGEPGNLKGVLDHVVGTTDPDVVDLTTWWLAPQQAASVLKWEMEHLPSRFVLQAWGPGPLTDKNPVIFDEYSLPPVPGVLSSRDLQVSAAKSESGQAYIRVDAQVAWIPVRPSSEKIPASARVVTITYQPSAEVFPAGSAQSRNRPASVTITDLARVRKISAFINELSRPAPGVFSCPAYSGGHVEVTFRDSAGGMPVAEAVIDLTGCPDTALTIGGVQQPVLDAPQTFVQQVLRTAGIQVAPYT